jgi:hypothetical protein
MCSVNKCGVVFVMQCLGFVGKNAELAFVVWCFITKGGELGFVV